jgi:hypothetical protein
MLDVMQWHMQTKITNRNGAFSIFFSAMNYKHTDAVAIAMPLLIGSTSKCTNCQKRTLAIFDIKLSRPCLSKTLTVS